MLVMANEKTLTYTTRVLTCTSTCSEYAFRSFLSDANEKKSLTIFTTYLFYILMYSTYSLQIEKKSQDLVISHKSMRYLGQVPR